jgi:CRP/FNR family cyclic AMP-dependent transcriptional regulator
VDDEASRGRRSCNSEAFRELDRRLIEELLEKSLPLDLAPGAILYPEEGKPRMALVIRGLVRVYLTSAEGRQITVQAVSDASVL